MSLSNNLIGTTNWEPTLLRLTAFLSPSAEITSQKWWNELTGELPETQNVQPRTGEKVEAGHYRDATLTLRTQPIRVDWLFSVEESPIGTAKLSTLGNFNEALEIFSGLVSRWLEKDDMPNLIRLAFGATLVQPMKTRNDAYSLLKSYLPFEIDLENASDFLYQINRQRPSEVDISSLSINRLSKWAALQVEEQILAPVSSSSKSIYAILELDISTGVEYEGELPHSKLGLLFEELFTFGEEISVRGDIP